MTAMALEPDTLEQRIQSQCKKKPCADKRLCAIAIALVGLIFGLDLLFQYF